MNLRQMSPMLGHLWCTCTCDQCVKDAECKCSFCWCDQGASWKVPKTVTEHCHNEEPDDGDDDELPPYCSYVPEDFDGGYGQGSYFQHAMKKDD